MPPLFPGLFSFPGSIRPRSSRSMTSASISVPLRRRLVDRACPIVRRRSSRVHSPVAPPPGSQPSRLPVGSPDAGTRPGRRRLRLCARPYARAVRRVKTARAGTRLRSVIGGAPMNQLEDVVLPDVDLPIRAERVVRGVGRAGDQVDDAPAAARAGHDPVPGVAAVEVAGPPGPSGPRYGRRSGVTSYCPAWRNQCADGAPSAQTSRQNGRDPRERVVRVSGRGGRTPSRARSAPGHAARWAASRGR